MPKYIKPKFVKLDPEKWEEISKNKDRLNAKGGAKYYIADTIYEANKVLTEKLNEEESFGTK